MTIQLPDSVHRCLTSVPSWGTGDNCGHFLTGLEPGREGVLSLLALAASIREHQEEIAHLRPLSGRSFAGMFFDPSLRTRQSMHIACAKLGAAFLDLQPGSGMWTLEFRDEVTMDGGAAEHVYEAAGVLGRYADILGIRAFPTRGQWERERTQPVHQAFADHAGTPVINLEGPMAHPCQGLADSLTLSDLLDEPRKQRFVVTWAPHPKQLPMATAHSAIWAGTTLGCEVVLTHPEGFELDPVALEEAQRLSRESGGSFSVTNDRRAALEGADVVYAKAWGAVSGPEASVAGHADAVSSLRNWTVRSSDLELGAPALFMHCLPIRRNVVASADVLEGPQSVVLHQAENRIWTQAALMMAMLTERDRA
ncbi:MAG: N-acetylornithine carbamoyltransferase [Myxococcota bacterium]|nr:N-acetylornithine carbamoyltransferase [Myxococcota bacterium]